MLVSDDYVWDIVIEVVAMNFACRPIYYLCM